MSNLFKYGENRSRFIANYSASVRQQVLEIPPSLEKEAKRRDGTSVKTLKHSCNV